MLTNAEKIARLRMAIDSLKDADAWVAAALGADTDSYQFTQVHIEHVIDDLKDDIAELDSQRK